MKETLRNIIWLIAGAVIFMIVYTLWTNPTIITTRLDSLKFTTANKEINEELNPSHQTCLNEINQRGELWRQKSSSGAFFNIIDSKHFDNSQDALNYLDSWSFTIFRLSYESIISEDDDITIAVVKLGNNQGSVSYPFICTDGKLITEYFNLVAA